jgi:hypothetical protein
MRKRMLPGSPAADGPPPGRRGACAPHSVRSLMGGRSMARTASRAGGTM